MEIHEMDPKQAINTIRLNWPPKKDPQLEAALEMAVEALEKQVPKKIVLFQDDPEWPDCPSCDFSLQPEDVDPKVDDHFHYCPDCGQRLEV